MIVWVWQATSLLTLLGSIQLDAILATDSHSMRRQNPTRPLSPEFPDRAGRSQEDQGQGRPEPDKSIRLLPF
jgi:hypothetical protein